MNKSKITLFEGKKIRRIWDGKNEKWFFSVVDVITVLTGSSIPRRYWSDLKLKLKNEGSQVYEKIVQLKFLAPDGKYYLSDAADTEAVFRIIQAIPSPNAEPFKLWLARVGKERLDEIQNPELSMERMRLLYEKKGYPKSWIDKRMRGIAVRQDLTNEWQNRGAKTQTEYAILTNEIMIGTFDMGVQKHKDFKGLAIPHNLRDHMTDLELILTMLAEATTTKIHQDRESQGVPKLKVDARDGGAVAGRTRRDIERQTKKPVASKENYLHLRGEEGRGLLE